VLKYVAAALALILATGAGASAQQGAFSVDANVALSSLVALGDGHLQTVADTLETLAATDAVRSSDWSRIAGPLKEAASVNLAGVYWYAKRDGSYWTVGGGKQSANLTDRPYFARVLSGKTDIGELVRRRSTGHPVAVIAVPVSEKKGTIVGVLGASLYLDAFSATIKREMGIRPGMLFWSIDRNGTIALHSDANAIFVEPAKASAEQQRYMRYMLDRDAGTQTYTFRGQKRTVIFRLSGLTGWRYGFGIIR
jgi:hypothetical protein